MSHDPEPSIAKVAEADEQFRRQVEYVESPVNLRSTAYEVELSLFREVLALGSGLLKIFTDRKAAASGPPQGDRPGRHQTGPRRKALLAAVAADSGDVEDGVPVVRTETCDKGGPDLGPGPSRPSLTAR